MREIKFRAWDNLKKSMANVGGMHFDGVGIEQAYMEYNNTPINDWDWMPLDCIEVMQYTGLKDKNGKEIYEGDIITTPDVNGDPTSDKASVTFKEGSFVFAYSWKETFINWFWTHGYEIEVIGNIWQNPELLGKGEK